MLSQHLSFSVVFILGGFVAAAAGEHALADDDLTVLRANATVPPRRMLRMYLLNETHKAFEARREAIAQLASPADIQRRQQQLRARFIGALGGFPERTPLNSQVVGHKVYLRKPAAPPRYREPISAGRAAALPRRPHADRA
jgi:hypothetical protein